MGLLPSDMLIIYMPSLKADSIVKVDRFEVARCSKMTYQQLKLVISQQLIPYFPYLKKIYSSVMDSSLPRIALTMVSRKKKILLLKKNRDNPVLIDFKTEPEDRCWWEVNQGNTSEK
ncbi:unnamed protein product [Brassica oleracea]